MKNIILRLILLLSLSVCLNFFQWSNATVTCENIDAHWKVDLLYFLWHKHLDGDIMIEYLANIYLLINKRNKNGVY